MPEKWSAKKSVAVKLVTVDQRGREVAKPFVRRNIVIRHAGLMRALKGQVQNHPALRRFVGDLSFSFTSDTVRITCPQAKLTAALEEAIDTATEAAFSEFAPTTLKTKKS